MFQMKEQENTSTKWTKWSGDRQPSRKRIQNKNSENNPGSQKKNGGYGGKDWKDARDLYQRIKNKQTNKDEKYSTIPEMKNTQESIAE